MRIERVTQPDERLARAVGQLIPQLSPKRTAPGLPELEEMAAAPGTSLLVAFDGEDVLGMLTLVLYRVPTGIRGWIHDVVVDEATRGRGVGGELTAEALRLAEKAGAVSVELTTRAERAEANRLYQRLGFERRETNVYVWRPNP